jgi:excisionase family DNA binding protein
LTKDRGDEQLVVRLVPDTMDDFDPNEDEHTFRAADLAAILEAEVLDVEGAARYLGLAKNSVEYAAYRKRIPHVQFGAKKLFTRDDLADYKGHRGRGRDSQLATVPPYVVSLQEWDKLFGSDGPDGPR